MPAEPMLETQGSAFVRVFEYDEDGNWNKVLMVQNSLKDLTEKVITNWVTRTRTLDGGVNLARLEEIIVGERVQFGIKLPDLLKFAGNQDVLRRHLPTDFPQHSFDLWMEMSSLANGQLSEGLLKKYAPADVFCYTLSNLVRLSSDISGKLDPLQLAKHMIARINKRIIKLAGKGLPGGGVRSDETPEEGGLRELFEESSFILDIGDDWLERNMKELTAELFERKEGSKFLALAVRSRCETIKRYAEEAKRLGLIRRCERHCREKKEDGSPMWVLDADGRNLISVKNPNSVFDPAKNTTSALWVTRDQAEDAARNYREYSKNDATRFYRSHLERLDLTIG